MTMTHDAYTLWFQETYKCSPIGGLGSSDYRAFHAGACWQEKKIKRQITEKNADILARLRDALGEDGAIYSDIETMLNMMLGEEA